MSDLPSGWLATALSELVRINPRSVPDHITDESLVSFVPMAAVEEATGRADVRATRAWGAVRKGYTLMQDGDVIFAKITPCMENGKVALLHGLKNGVGAGSTEFVVLRPSAALYPPFLLHFVLQAQLRREARGVMQGAAGQLRVPTSFFSSLRLPLPPLAEQRRIVAALEEHLSDLDAGMEGLERARAKTERFLGAVIEHHVAGVRAGRAMEPLRQLVAALDQGWSPKCHSTPASAGEWGVIKTTAIQPLHFQANANKRLPSELSPRPGLSLRAGDLLITRAGPRSRVGISCVVPSDQSQLMNCDKVYRVRLRQDRVRPEYIAIVLNAPSYLRLLDELKSGISDSGVNLTQDRFLDLAVPLPLLEEQDAILRDIAVHQSVIGHTLHELGVQRARAARLRQSILKRAFEGKLVSQDRRDEHASELLARVRNIFSPVRETAAGTHGRVPRSRARGGRD